MRVVEPFPRVPDDVPQDVMVVVDALRAGLDRVLGDALAGLFLYGAIAFPRPERWAVDMDFHVFLHRPLADAEHGGIDALYGELAAVSELGGDLDGYFVLLADAARAEPPEHQLNPGVRDEAWALHRAHVHAGRYFPIAGVDPREVVPEPTWPELDAALRAEMRFVDSHPNARAFGILNGCRILRSFETRDVVTSKYAAAQWALDSLPAEWQGAIHAALRWYQRAATADNARTLEEQWAPFVAYVNRIVPPT